MLNEISNRLRAAAHRFKVRLRFTSAPQTVNRHRVVNPWSAVSVKTALVDACPAAKALQNQRFLSSEAPKLPLPNCNMRHSCTCRFAHHADRRTSPRRARDHGLPGRHHVGTERRTSHGRRFTD